MTKQQTARVKRLIRKAGRIAKTHFSTLRKTNVFEKSRYERVTTVDKKIHALLKKQLPYIVPVPVLSEENKNKWKKVPSFWVVDPLDGTTNYYTRIPFFCVAIGLVLNNDIILNAVYNPMLDELFFAEKHKGTWLNNTRLRKDHFLPLVKSIVSMSYAHSHQSVERAGKIGLHVRRRVHNIRHAGSTVLTLAYVAAGRLEASIIVGPVTAWDTITGLLLVSEVRGTITDFQGRAYKLMHSKNIIASNGADHAKLVRMVRSVRS